MMMTLMTMSMMMSMMMRAIGDVIALKRRKRRFEAIILLLMI